MRVLHSARFGPDNIDGFNMISLLLPGVAVTYNGEEIGMVNTEVSWEDTVDPAGLNCGEEHFNVRLYIIIREGKGRTEG